MGKQTDYSMRHPTTAELDQWRAGLLDRNPAQREALTAHVSSCGVCQEQTEIWSHVRESLDTTNDATVAGRLRARRFRALRGTASHAPRRWTMAFALAAALTAVAIGLGTFVFMHEQPAELAPVAENESGDVVADIDFYLWLMEKQVDQDASPSG